MQDFSHTAIHNRIMDAIHPQLSRAHWLEDELREPFHGTGRRRADGEQYQKTEVARADRITADMLVAGAITVQKHVLETTNDLINALSGLANAFRPRDDRRDDMTGAA